MRDRRTPSQLRVLVTCALLGLASVVFGFLNTQYRWPLATLFNEIRQDFLAVSQDLNSPIFLQGPAAPHDIGRPRPSEEAPGLILISGINTDKRAFAQVIDRDGTVIQTWLPNWFEIWQEPPSYIPADRIPKQHPGSVLHGMKIIENGDLVFNFELLSTGRLNACNQSVWQLDNLGHHSVELAEDGTIFVGAEIAYLDAPTPIPNHRAPLISPVIQQLDQDGNTLLYKEIFEILQQNGLTGLMHLSSQSNTDTSVFGDTLHLNDIEVFPSDLPSDVFAPGDLMLSLRNINTILVVDPRDWTVKFQSTGQVLRQHDPDFGPDNTITVYDNRNLEPLVTDADRHSRIAVLDAATGTHATYFRGQGRAAWAEDTLGNHQILPNGNIMIVSGWHGRAFEVNQSGDLVWEYFNRVSPDHTGVITEAQVLPPGMDAAFFARAREACQ